METQSNTRQTEGLKIKMTKGQSGLRGWEIEVTSGANDEVFNKALAHVIKQIEEAEKQMKRNFIAVSGE